MDVSFLNPWLLLGLAGAALPVIIHLIGRRNAPTQPFAAFDFLMAVNRRLARREKLRQWLLLLMRTLAVIALVMAVARPMPELNQVQSDVARKIAMISVTRPLYLWLEIFGFERAELIRHVW